MNDLFGLGGYGWMWLSWLLPDFTRLSAGALAQGAKVALRVGTVRRFGDSTNKVAANA